MANDPSTGIELADAITDTEHAELDFLRYATAHLQSRVTELEKQLLETSRDRDTIRHERNLMAQDFQWTLNRLNNSPIAPMLRRMDGFNKLNEKWGRPS
jgi:hypothetical protein